MMTKHLDEVADAVRGETGFIIKHPQVPLNVAKAVVTKLEEIMLSDEMVRLMCKAVEDCEDFTVHRKLRAAINAQFNKIKGE